MILQALNRYYDVLLEREGDSMPREEYSSADASFEVCLDDQGAISSIIPYSNDAGKEIRRSFIVPKQAKRSSGIFPYFLCDKAEYMFGSALSMQGAYKEESVDDKLLKKSDEQKAMREICREEMVGLANAVLQFADVESAEITALQQFLAFTPQQLVEQLSRSIDINLKISLCNGGLCVLKYAPTGKYFHNDRNILRAWEKHFNGSKAGSLSGQEQMCLITGKQTPSHQIARLHPNIKNIVGAQSAGASIVSFNIESFRSYGLDQSYNAPTSQKAAEAYGYVLNKFLADPNHRVRMNDTTVVFWAETAGVNEQELLSSLFGSFSDDETNGVQDEDSIRTRVKSAVNRIRQGQAFQDAFQDLNEDAQFYVLGLSPNAARLSIRFWYTGTLGEIGKQVWKHYEDLAIEGLDRSPTIRELLRETAVAHDWKNIPPNMEGQMLRSVLLGLPYSRAVFSQLINRIRADSDDPKKHLYKIGAVRAAMIKAYLIRTSSNTTMKGEITMALNPQSTSVPYQLGRLFACLEKTQTSALGQGINATIRDRFWGAASATPATVFPRLLSLSQHHISKDEEWGRSNDFRIQEVMNALPEQFPKRLSLEEQGMFALGYYQQRQDFYTKKTGN